MKDFGKEYWQIEFRCINCERELKDFQRSYNYGYCPYCGYKGASCRTIAKCTEHLYKIKRYGKWWEFWKKRKIYLGDTPKTP